MFSGINWYRTTVALRICPSAYSGKRSKCTLCFWAEKFLIVVITEWYHVKPSWNLSVKVFFYQEVGLNRRYTKWQPGGALDMFWRWSQVEIFVYASWQQMQVRCKRESAWSFLPYLDPECKWCVRSWVPIQIHKDMLSLDCRKVNSFVFRKPG